MHRTFRSLSIIIIVMGLIALVMGVVFIAQGYSKQNYLVSSMKMENIKLGDLGITGSGANNVIDNAKSAQIVADKVREDRHSIAPSYEALLNGGHFDPTNPKQLSYAQALNLENYLYLAVASFGLINIALATGGFMIITGVAFGISGFVLFRLAMKIPANQ